MEKGLKFCMLLNLEDMHNFYYSSYFDAVFFLLIDCDKDSREFPDPGDFLGQKWFSNST